MDLRALLSSLDEALNDPVITSDSHALVMVRRQSEPADSPRAWYVVPVIDVDAWDDERIVELVVVTSAGEPPLPLDELRGRLRVLHAGQMEYEVCSATHGQYKGDPQLYRRDMPIVRTWWDEHGFALLQGVRDTPEQ